jgi:uncharacterized protein (TIGR02118 family)
MIKNLGLIPRRADLARRAFREYYEQRHAPLALKHLRWFRRYVRNHVVAATPVDPAFDALSEFWYDDAADLETVIAFLTSTAGLVLRDDEAQFMNRAGIRIVRTEESLLFGPARGTEQGVVKKQALLVHRSSEASAADFRADVERACAALLEPRAPTFARLQLDLPVDPDEPGLAVDALLTAWPDTDGRAAFDRVPELPSFVATTRLAFESIETPPELLRD